MIQHRKIHLPLFCVYRDGLLVGAFPSMEAAAAYEDALEDASDAAAAAAAEPTPIYGEAADAVTVALLSAGEKLR